MEPLREKTKFEGEEPDLLDELLIQGVATEPHRQRWLDASLRGQAIHLLQKERARHGYLIFPVWEFLGDLAHNAHVSLDTVLAAFDLDSRPVVSERTAAQIAKVLRRIGCVKRESLQMMRLSFAEVHGFPVRPELMVLWRGKSAEPDVDACERALLRVETDYPDELKAELERIVRAVNEQFQDER